jgi:phenylalanyl-tRNA synthetase beta subunit
MGSFDAECLALRECERSDATPKLLAQARLVQDHYDIYPGGYVSVIVMSKVSGQRIVEFLQNLTDDEKRTIRADLIQILEYVHWPGCLPFHAYVYQVYEAQKLEFRRAATGPDLLRQGHSQNVFPLAFLLPIDYCY